MNQHINKILVPIDFSEQSIVALEQSYNLAREYHAEITLLYIIEDNGLFAKLVSGEQNYDLQIDELKKNIQERLDALAAAAEQKSKLDIKTIIVKGAIYEKIAEVAEVINATMIIMGTNGGE